MKVIFLDFDGVLNSAAQFHMNNRKTAIGRKGIQTNEILCEVCCSTFRIILDQVPDAKIVLTTTWRELFSMDWLKAKLMYSGIDPDRVIGKTGSDYRGRGQEIMNWLDAHPEVQDQYVIIDDNDDGISALFGRPETGPTNFVQTSWLSGIEINHAMKAIQILGEHPNWSELPI